MGKKLLILILAVIMSVSAYAVNCPPLASDVGAPPDLNYVQNPANGWVPVGPNYYINPTTGQEVIFAPDGSYAEYKGPKTFDGTKYTQIEYTIEPGTNKVLEEKVYESTTGNPPWTLKETKTYYETPDGTKRVRIEKPDGSIEDYDLDSNCNPTTLRYSRSAGGSEGWLGPIYKWDGNTYSTYDSAQDYDNNNPSSVYDYVNGTTTYYDDNGNITEKHFPDGTIEYYVNGQLDHKYIGSGPNAGDTEYYNEFGDVEKIEKANGDVHYIEDGVVRKIEYANGDIDIFDANGTRISHYDAANKITYYYDSTGAITEYWTHGTDGRIDKYKKDSSGNFYIYERIDADGTIHHYDQNGNEVDRLQPNTGLPNVPGNLDCPPGWTRIATQDPDGGKYGPGGHIIDCINPVTKEQIRIVDPFPWDPHQSPNRPDTPDDSYYVYYVDENGNIYRFESGMKSNKTFGGGPPFVFVPGKNKIKEAWKPDGTYIKYDYQTGCPGYTSKVIYPDGAVQTYTQSPPPACIVTPGTFSPPGTEMPPKKPYIDTKDYRNNLPDGKNEYIATFDASNNEWIMPVDVLLNSLPLIARLEIDTNKNGVYEQTDYIKEDVMDLVRVDVDPELLTMKYLLRVNGIQSGQYDARWVFNGIEDDPTDFTLVLPTTNFNFAITPDLMQYTSTYSAEVDASVIVGEMKVTEVENGDLLEVHVYSNALDIPAEYDQQVYDPITNTIIVADVGYNETHETSTVFSYTVTGVTATANGQSYTLSNGTNNVGAGTLEYTSGITKKVSSTVNINALTAFDDEHTIYDGANVPYCVMLRYANGTHYYRTEVMCTDGDTTAGDGLTTGQSTEVTGQLENIKVKTNGNQMIQVDGTFNADFPTSGTGTLTVTVENSGFSGNAFSASYDVDFTNEGGVIQAVENQQNNGATLKSFDITYGDLSLMIHDTGYSICAVEDTTVTIAITEGATTWTGTTIMPATDLTCAGGKMLKGDSPQNWN